MASEYEVLISIVKRVLMIGCRVLDEYSRCRRRREVVAGLPSAEVAEVYELE